MIEFWRERTSEATMASDARRIDVHCHSMTPAYREAISRLGPTIRTPEWTPKRRSRSSIATALPPRCCRCRFPEPISAMTRRRASSPAAATRKPPSPSNDIRAASERSRRCRFRMCRAPARRPAIRSTCSSSTASGCSPAITEPISATHASIRSSKFWMRGPPSS